MCTAGVKDALAEGSESFKDKAIRDDHQKQYSKAMDSAQHNVGQASGDMYDSFQMGMEGVQEFVNRNTESLRPQSQDTPEVSDTQSANYSKSSSEKSSQSTSKAKKKGGEGTGGSKSQFYAKK